MAIKGLVEMEDLKVSWTNEADGVELKSDELFVVMDDGFDGKHWAGVLDGPTFMKALATGITWDGSPPSEEDGQAANEQIEAITGFRIAP